METPDEPVQLAKKPRAAADFPRAEGDLALEPDDPQAFAPAAAKEVVKLVGIRELTRGRGGEGDVASGGSEAFGQAIDVVFAGKAAGKFFRKNGEKFHGG